MIAAAAVARDRDSPPLASRRRSTAAWRAAVGIGIGAGVALCGFAPVNQITDKLDVVESGWRVALTPEMGLALLALCAAVAFPAQRPRPVPPLLVLAGCLLLAGGTLSVAGSDDSRLSATVFVIALVSPTLLVISLLRADLNWNLVAGGFIGALVAALLRADIVFLRMWGFPTSHALFQGKYSNEAYDFHYYTLGNPDHTAGFLLMPLVLVVFWMLEEDMRPRVRVLLSAAGGVILGTLILTYARFAIGNALIVLALAVLVARTSQRVKRATLIGLGTVTLAMIVVSLDYLRGLLSTDNSASLPERLNSLGDGLSTMSHHLFEGVGLAQYGPAGGYFAAHSSIIQGGAEMGLLGLLGLTALTVALIQIGIRTVRRDGWTGLAPAAAIAIAIYAVHAALAGPASEGLFSGNSAIWAMTIALMTVIALSAERTGT